MLSKGRFDRVKKGDSTIESDEFMDATPSVWEIPAESAKRVGHPAPFPIELPRRFIELYTYADDLVLDPFLGSGTTAVAAVKAGRHYVGYDIDDSYVEVAERRIAAARREMQRRRYRLIRQVPWHDRGKGSVGGGREHEDPLGRWTYCRRRLARRPCTPALQCRSREYRASLTTAHGAELVSTLIDRGRRSEPRFRVTSLNRSENNNC